jgi:hypothetical protein
MPGSTLNTHLRRTALVLAMATGLALGSGSTLAAGSVDPEADKILREMSAYLSGLAAFSVLGDVDDEVIDLEGQKLQLSSAASLVVERPGRIYAHRQGPLADVEALFDGSTVTLHGKRLGAYVVLPVEGSIDDAITELRAETDLGFPGADLFYADPYSGLMTDVTSGSYLGTAFVQGTEVHHLAYRARRVDWQLWVKTGAEPLPMKYVITSKWLTGAPEYSVRFRDWNTAPAIEPGQFQFSAPDGATRVEFLSPDDLGTVRIEEVR